MFNVGPVVGPGILKLDHNPTWSALAVATGRICCQRRLISRASRFRFKPICHGQNREKECI